jgi:hypothetical protein
MQQRHSLSQDLGSRCRISNAVPITSHGQELVWTHEALNSRAKGLGPQV